MSIPGDGLFADAHRGLQHGYRRLFESSEEQTQPLNMDLAGLDCAVQRMDKANMKITEMDLTFADGTDHVSYSLTAEPRDTWALCLPDPRGTVPHSGPTHWREQQPEGAAAKAGGALDSHHPGPMSASVEWSHRGKVTPPGCHQPGWHRHQGLCLGIGSDHVGRSGDPSTCAKGSVVHSPGAMTSADQVWEAGQSQGGCFSPSALSVGYPGDASPGRHLDVSCCIPPPGFRSPAWSPSSQPDMTPLAPSTPEASARVSRTPEGRRRTGHNRDRQVSRLCAGAPGCGSEASARLARSPSPLSKGLRSGGGLAETFYTGARAPSPLRSGTGAGAPPIGDYAREGAMASAGTWQREAQASPVPGSSRAQSDCGNMSPGSPGLGSPALLTPPTLRFRHRRSMSHSLVPGFMEGAAVVEGPSGNSTPGKPGAPAPAEPAPGNDVLSRGGRGPRTQNPAAAELGGEHSWAWGPTTQPSSEAGKAASGTVPWNRAFPQSHREDGFGNLANGPGRLQGQGPAGMAPAFSRHRRSHSQSTAPQAQGDLCLDSIVTALLHERNSGVPSPAGQVRGELPSECWMGPSHGSNHEGQTRPSCTKQHPQTHCHRGGWREMSPQGCHSFQAPARAGGTGGRNVVTGWSPHKSGAGGSPGSVSQLPGHGHPRGSTRSHGHRRSMSLSIVPHLGLEDISRALSKEATSAAQGLGPPGHAGGMPAWQCPQDYYALAVEHRSSRTPVRWALEGSHLASVPHAAAAAAAAQAAHAQVHNPWMEGSHDSGSGRQCGPCYASPQLHKSPGQDEALAGQGVPGEQCSPFSAQRPFWLCPAQALQGSSRSPLARQGSPGPIRQSERIAEGVPGAAGAMGTCGCCRKGCQGCQQWPGQASIQQEQTFNSRREQSPGALSPVSQGTGPEVPGLARSPRRLRSQCSLPAQHAHWPLHHPSRPGPSTASHAGRHQLQSQASLPPAHPPSPASSVGTGTRNPVLSGNAAAGSPGCRGHAPSLTRLPKCTSDRVQSPSRLQRSQSSLPPSHLVPACASPGTCTSCRQRQPTLDAYLDKRRPPPLRSVSLSKAGTHHQPRMSSSETEPASGLAGNPEWGNSMLQKNPALLQGPGPALMTGSTDAQQVNKSGSPVSTLCGQQGASQRPVPRNGAPDDQRSLRSASPLLRTCLQPGGGAGSAEPAAKTLQSSSPARRRPSPARCMSIPEGRGLPAPEEGRNLFIPKHGPDRSMGVSPLSSSGASPMTSHLTRSTTTPAPVGNELDGSAGNSPGPLSGPWAVLQKSSTQSTACTNCRSSLDLTPVARSPAVGPPAAATAAADAAAAVALEQQGSNRSSPLVKKSHRKMASWAGGDIWAAVPRSTSVTLWDSARTPERGGREVNCGDALDMRVLSPLCRDHRPGRSLEQKSLLSWFHGKMSMFRRSSGAVSLRK